MSILAEIISWKLMFDLFRSPIHIRWQRRLKQFLKMKSALSFVIVILISVTSLSCSSFEETPAPCTSGFDVRNLDDSNIPQSLKEKIFNAPGPIINVSSPSYPSGQIVVIRAASLDWPGNPFVTGPYIDEIFFNTHPIDKSIAAYFVRNSYGDFHVTKGAVPHFITLQKNLTSYAPGIEGNQLYAKDVLQLANVNWNVLDLNKDGIISRRDAQIIVLIPNATPPPNATGFASTRTVNVGSVNTPNGVFNFGSRPIVYFSVKATSDPQHSVHPIRFLAAVAHELSHAFFKLPDRYGTNTGTGEYDMMGSAGSSKWLHLTMHDKIKIGWINPKIVNAHLGKCLQFVSSALQNAALVLVPPEQFLSQPLEYWIVENRNKKYDNHGFDDDLPDTGLAVWYVREGTYSVGHNDVRLVDFSKPDQDPDLYNNPGNNALFKRNDANHKRLLLSNEGEWTLLYFQNVSDIAGSSQGLFMYAEF